MWGSKQKDELTTLLDKAKDDYKTKHATDMPDDEVKTTKARISRTLKDEILAMAILKRADKTRYGSLQVELRNSYLLGKNDYPTNVPDMLKVLNNYESAHPNVPSPTGNVSE